MNFKSILLFAMALAIGLFCASCAGLTSALSGDDIASTEVQRAGDEAAPIVLVSAADYAVAEQAAPGTVHGLYNAGKLAEQARGLVVDPSK